MRRLGAVLTVAIATTLLASPADAARKRPKVACASKGSKTVINTRDVRVYTERETSRILGRGTNYYGCLKSKDDSVLLAFESQSDFDTSSNVTVKVAGRFAAVDEVVNAGCARVQQCPADNPDGIGSDLTVTDLRRPKSKRKLALTDPAAAYVVTQRGGLAVLRSDGVLVGVDAGGTRILDSGAIVLRSLRAEISIVSWLRDGVERFARLN